MKRFKALWVLIPLAVFALATVVVMLLWNSVVVNIFAVPVIGFWYSAGLLLLCKLLFGGFHKFGHHGPHGHKGHRGGFAGRKCKGGNGTDAGDDPFDTVREMHERFHSMSRDERREHIRRHFGSGSGTRTGGGDTAPGDNGKNE